MLLENYQDFIGSEGKSIPRVLQRHTPADSNFPTLRQRATVTRLPVVDHTVDHAEGRPLSFRATINMAEVRAPSVRRTISKPVKAISIGKPLGSSNQVAKRGLGERELYLATW